MEKRGVLTRVLAIAGATLAWFPFVAPVVLSLLQWGATGVPRFDYLTPAELFPVALAGGLILLWAAARARSRRGLIAWGLAAMVASLFASQAAAVVTGLASGAREASGWPWALVVTLLALYVVALAVVAVSGVLLVSDASAGHTG